MILWSGAARNDDDVQFDAAVVAIGDTQSGSIDRARYEAGVGRAEIAAAQATVMSHLGACTSADVMRRTAMHVLQIVDVAVEI